MATSWDPSRHDWPTGLRERINDLGWPYRRVFGPVLDLWRAETGGSAITLSEQSGVPLDRVRSFCQRGEFGVGHAEPSLSELLKLDHVLGPALGVTLLGRLCRYEGYAHPLPLPTSTRLNGRIDDDAAPVLRALASAIGDVAENGGTLDGLPKGQLLRLRTTLQAGLAHVPDLMGELDKALKEE